MNSYPANINPAAVHLLKEFSNSLRDLSVLELGCNFGALGKYFRNSLKNKNVTWHGIDYNKDAVEVANTNIDKAYCFDLNKVTKAELDSLKENINPNIILMIDTLEHLATPERLLSLLLTVYPKAPLLVVLPNISCLTIIDQLSKGEFNYTQHGILDYTHLKHFTPKSAYRFFDKYGYTITRDPVFLNEPRLKNLGENRIYPTTVQYNDIQLSVESQTDLTVLISYGFGFVAHPK